MKNNTRILTLVFVVAFLTLLTGCLTPPNQTPIITSDPITTATVGVEYIYNVDATDPDGDVLTYSLTTKPSGMTINSANGLIKWTPTTKGNYAVIVKISDGDLDITQSFTIVVSEADLEISFDPDPVHCENECLDWRVIISETKGVGVNLKTMVADVYVGDNYIGNDFTINEAEINEVWGTSYLSAFSSMDDFNCRWCPCEGNTGITIKYKVTGIDDNGHQVEATAELELMD